MPSVIERQARRFREMLQGMPQASQTRFQTIYQLAPRHKPTRFSAASGPHVRLAMLEALRDPDIRYWVRMNLAVRVALKFAQTTGLHPQTARLQGVLEAFHIAADAFVLSISLEEALQQRTQKTQCLSVSDNGDGKELISHVLSAEEIEMMRQFRRQIVPGMAQSIRQRYARIGI